MAGNVDVSPYQGKAEQKGGMHTFQIRQMFSPPTQRVHTQTRLYIHTDTRAHKANKEKSRSITLTSEEFPELFSHSSKHRAKLRELSPRLFRRSAHIYSTYDGRQRKSFPSYSSYLFFSPPPSLFSLFIHLSSLYASPTRRRYARAS